MSVLAGSYTSIDYQEFKNLLDSILFNISIPITGTEVNYRIPHLQLSKGLKEKDYSEVGYFRLVYEKGLFLKVYVKKPSSHVLVSFYSGNDEIRDIWINMGGEASSDLKDIFSKKKIELNKAIESLEKYLVMLDNLSKEPV